MTKVILVEDDERLSSLIQRYLQQNHFEVDVVHNGNLAVDAILSTIPDLVILDLMLPGLDGLSICRKIREHYHGLIIFLTASEDDIDHVVGVELGADDFIIKPIKPRVLLARIRMLLRRSNNTPCSEQAIAPNNELSNATYTDLQFGALSIQHSKRHVALNNERISLTTSEFDLLWLLASHAEEVLSRETLYQTLRGIEYDGMDRAMDTKIANLRRKLGDHARMSTRIITVRGQGYLFVPDNWD
ncbi:Transcriptional regulatory protein RstA [BD1-7 clade bacterium]|uniref:Transcriptional regulatory protein RstA n=1 Tax=BD1-7 clade bacterium TaxID=2029982 RepID=A0A5S9PT22_9GAMM|nr:Transcriptional regulatory protein RstA [BD1-7 clade bacterium]